MRRFTLLIVLMLLALGASRAPAVFAQQTPSTVEALHRPLDQLLDINVRDGLVYYRALQSGRGALDRYVASLNVAPATYAGWSREQQMAFWVNAYNAIVLQTVIDHYPVRRKSADYPAGSIRLIPGAFDKTTHRLAGRSLTLDEIEKTVLPEFKEPRLYLALGRGALGSGRLRSEAYSGDRIAKQLDAVTEDFMARKQMITIDRANATISLTPILSWREADFIAAYDPGATGPLAERAPIERAVLTFIAPHLLPLEKEMMQKNAFRLTFHPFDWRLNDLTGGRPD